VREIGKESREPNGEGAPDPVGFVHFRLEVEDDGAASVYVYELQLEPRAQRCGAGGRLMAGVEALGAALGRARHMSIEISVKHIRHPSFLEVHATRLMFQVLPTRPHRNLSGPGRNKC
jgi:GNAT superfamily N-acetyltransferase